MGVSQPQNQRDSRPLPPGSASAEYWVHWRYSAVEWQAWTAAELARARAAWLRRWIVPNVIGLVLVVPCLWCGTFYSGFTFYPRIAGLLFLCIFVLVVGTGLYGYSVARHTGDQSYHGPHEVAISPRWVWQDGQFTPLLRSMHKGFRVDLINGSPMWLRFDIDDIERGAGNDWTIRRRTISVPVPREGTAEARQLVARFEREIIGVPPPP